MSKNNRYRDFFTVSPGQLRLSKWLSYVSSTAPIFTAVAAMMASGSLRLVYWRNLIASSSTVSSQGNNRNTIYKRLPPGDFIRRKVAFGLQFHADDDADYFFSVMYLRPWGVQNIVFIGFGNSGCSIKRDYQLSGISHPIRPARPALPLWHPQ